MSRRQHTIFEGFGLAALAVGALLTPLPAKAEADRLCTCSDGRSLEAGSVSYSRNSDRETITKIEVARNPSGNRCRAIWIGSTEIYPRGNPYRFYLTRKTLREKRLDGCGDSTDRFVKRTKNYEFVFGSDSSSIREMRLVGVPDNKKNSGNDPQTKSNKNLWNSITEEDSVDVPSQRDGPPIDPTHEFNRTSWVLTRKEIKAHYVGIIKAADLSEKLVPLKKTRMVKVGQLGQIEAAKSDRAIVRFYRGSRIERFGGLKNSMRTWYDSLGGPYLETRDDLYTPLGAYILEVSVDDIVEVNDYLDQQKKDRT
ncbi:MAG TPA: hypothetical protein VK638_38895 [Edaphobacter sp.]|nr:hypothetical protein [Edaphobacter sp.]